AGSPLFREGNGAAGLPVSRHVGVAAPPADAIRAARDRRRVHLHARRAAAGPRRGAREPGAEGNVMPPVRVLIVDDSAYVRKIVKEMLVRGGVEVVGTARDGEEALRLVDELRPDVVTCDLI